MGDEGHNDPSGDWSAGTNKNGLGEIQNCFNSNVLLAFLSCKYLIVKF